MRRASESQGNSRQLTEYFSPRNKVEDPVFLRSPPHSTPLLQETPVKPSWFPRWLSHPPPMRMLPFQSPELCHRDRLDPTQHPPYPPGPFHSSGFVASSPTNIGSSVNSFQILPRGRQDTLQHQHRQPRRSVFSSPCASVRPTNSGSTPYRSPDICHPVLPQFMKDVSNHSPSSHIRRDHGTEYKISSSYSGSENVTAQTQASIKVQSSDVRSSIRTVQLHRPPITSSTNTRAVQKDYPLPPSDSGHWSPGNSQCPPLVYQPSDRSSASTLPNMHSPVASCQDQQHKRTPSGEIVIPEVDLNCSSQKRCREFENCDDSAKKRCLLGINSGKAQTPKPTVGNSLNTSVLSEPSSKQSSVLELSPKTKDGHLCTEPARGQSKRLEVTSTFKPTQSSGASVSPKLCFKRQPSMGAKQAYINSTQSDVLKLIVLKSPPKPSEEHFKKRGEENDKRDNSSSSLPSEVPQKDSGSSPRVQLGSHQSGHTYRSKSVLPVKSLSRENHVEESRKSGNSTPKPASKTKSGSVTCRTVERKKTSRPRRPVAIPDDINDLFTPDPMTYVVNPGHKTAKPKIDGIKSHTSGKSCSSSTVTSSSTSVTGSSCHETVSHAVDTKVSSLSSANLPQLSMPTVALERVTLEKLKSFCVKDSELKNSPIASTGRQLKDESVKSEKRTSLLTNNVRPCASGTATTTATSHCSQSPLLERRASEGIRKPTNEEDPLDVELDLGLSFELDMDQTQSSHSSEEEQLLSLQEMMERVTKPPDTPEKGAFSEPSTPGHRSSQSKNQPLPSTTKPVNYKNNLDQMLKEINNNKKTKELEIQLLSVCQEDLLRLAEYEEAEENQEEGISTEQQAFLQRYSLMSNAIREVPPGEIVFNLEKFGRIFDHNTLQLRQCMVKPQGTAQKTLLWSSPAQLRLHINIGLFQEAFDCRSPCPAQVTHFLFKMMSVHSERMLSERILQVLCDIACTAACQIVKNVSQQFKVWVPTLADVALVLMNMGIAFVTLFPFENLQPPFTEGDLLKDICIKSESPSRNKEQKTFPEHNCNNILKYLSYCMGLCPRAYSDDELLLLLTVVGRVGLDTRLILQSTLELYPLQYKIVNNIRDWEAMLPRICLALTDLTDDHHNMCLLVQLLPDSTRGKQLRRHLSLSMISKLLDGNCTYRPIEKELQLSELRPYLRRMQPSSLLRGMLSSASRSQTDTEEYEDTLDQQAYYLCYSLLTLANEASNLQFFPAQQKEQLLFLCSELGTHVKCDIRESEKCLYRSKVKDLVARIDTKWQMVLQRTRPLHDKLYDYWQPLPVETLTSGQEDRGMDNSENEQGPLMKEDEGEETNEEEEANETGEEEVAMISEDEEREDGDDTNKRGDHMKLEETEGDDALDDTNETGDDMKPEEIEVDNTVDDTKETEEATATILTALNQEMPEMEPQVHKQTDAGDVECRKSWLREGAACDLL